MPGNGRVTQKDLIVGGYLIPKGVGSVAVLCREHSLIFVYEMGSVTYIHLIDFKRFHPARVWRGKYSNDIHLYDKNGFYNWLVALLFFFLDLGPHPLIKFTIMTCS